jgi:hypothetical protein
MRRTLASLVVAAGLLAAPAPAPAACALGVEYRGAFYVGATPVPGARVEQGAPLRGGVVPGCDDVVIIGPDGRRENEPPPDTAVDLVRVAGVRAAVAVAMPGRSDVFIAPGFLPELASHPLHEALFAEPPRERCPGSKTVTRTGRIVSAPGFGRQLGMRGGGGQSSVAVGAATRVLGGTRRAGLPYLRKGDAIRVTGRRCGRTVSRPRRSGSARPGGGAARGGRPSAG